MNILNVSGMFLLIIGPFVFEEFYSKFVFIARGYCRRYGHGKSFNRAKRHYKNSWTFSQRIFWSFVFKEKYEHKYITMAYFSYAHLLLTLIVALCFIIDAFVLTKVAFFQYMYAILVVFFLIRYTYDNRIAREK